MQLNPKYPSLPREFVYKGIYWVSWSSPDIIKKIEDHFKFHSNDVLVATYPKSGTTLLQEMVWLIMNNADVEEAKKSRTFIRMPFIDENYRHIYPYFDGERLAIDIVDQWPQPRIMKTHLPMRNLRHLFDQNDTVKILVVLRNPKDTAVSMYHFYSGVIDYGPFTDGWEKFFQRWLDGWISGGDWLEVTKEWWVERHRSNLKIVFYEDLVKKRYQSIKEISEFLNVNLSEEQIKIILDHTEFESMKNNIMTNYKELFGFNESYSFMRKGEVGDWRNTFTEEQSDALDNKYNEILKEIGLEFQYE